MTADSVLRIVAGGGKRVAMAAVEILDRKCRRGDRERGKVKVRAGLEVA